MRCIWLRSSTCGTTTWPLNSRATTSAFLPRPARCAFRFGAASSLFSGQNLTCVRGGRTVFADVDFAVAAGGVLVLRGPNGSGKSSLLRLAAGFARPAAGALLWDGADIASDADAHRARLASVGP